jgi:hypothetical protein
MQPTNDFAIGNLFSVVCCHSLASLVPEGHNLVIKKVGASGAAARLLSTNDPCLYALFVTRGMSCPSEEHAPHLMTISCQTSCQQSLVQPRCLSFVTMTCNSRTQQKNATWTTHARCGLWSTQTYATHGWSLHSLSIRTQVLSGLLAAKSACGTCKPCTVSSLARAPMHPGFT